MLKTFLRWMDDLVTPTGVGSQQVHTFDIKQWACLFRVESAKYGWKIGV